MVERAKDRTGIRYGRLIAQERAAKVDKNWTWLCRCDCGNRIVVRGFDLAMGKTTSCGCSRKAPRKHGATRRDGWRAPGYVTWVQMKQRCFNPNKNRYARYGGRGISVCERWRDSFEAFLADMGPPPSDEHSLDRIDNDGDYEPGNCRWATRGEQRANQTLNPASWEGRPRDPHGRFAR